MVLIAAFVHYYGLAEMALKHVEELFRCEFDLAGNA